MSSFLAENIQILEAEKIVMNFTGVLSPWNKKSLGRPFFSSKIAWKFSTGGNLGEVASF